MITVSSVFRVTDYKTGASFQEVIDGCGQQAIGYLRKQYPRHSKFCIEGFEIEDSRGEKFIPVNLKK